MELLEDRHLLSITVNTLVDEADGSIVDGDVSLRDAIALAPHGETINFSVIGTINLLVGTTNSNRHLAINKSLTISGPGANLLTVNAFDPTPATNNGDGSRAFNVDDGTTTIRTVSISGLRLTGGDVDGDGGAISNAENLLLTSCLLQDNRAFGEGGGVDIRAGASATISGCTLTGNTGTYGGAIGVAGHLNLVSSTISGNSSSQVGGGIGHHPLHSGGNASLSGSNISGNTTEFAGGGVFIALGALSVTNCTITGNIATDGDSSGGGIFSRGTLTMTGTTVSGNTAFSYGGGMYVNDATVTASTIRNSAALYGGGIAHKGALVLIDSTISDNDATVGGGIGHNPVYSVGDLTISGSTISRNTAERGGGGIFSRSPHLSISMSTISDNVNAAYGGGGVLSLGMLTLTGSTVSGNSSPDAGGGIFANTGTIAQSTVHNNSARYGGGVSHGGPLSVTGSTISGNRATFGAGIGTEPGYPAALSLHNSTVSGNIALSGGGGIFSQHGGLSISNSTIVDNIGDEFGGGGIGTSGGGMLLNSIVARNFGPGGAPSDFDGVGAVAARFSLIGVGAGAPIIDNGGNLIGTSVSPINPLLGPLAENGGPTKTHAVLAESPAVNAGDPSASPLGTDQRSQPFARVADGRIDIGAYERQSAPGNQSFVVDTLVDEIDGSYGAGDLSLREAIGLANGFVGGPDVISFHPAIHGGAMVLTLGELSIHSAMAIAGPGAGALTIDASGNDPTPSTNNGDGSRIFFVKDADEGNLIDVYLSGLTLTGGDAQGSGGAILNQENLSVSDSVITGNAVGGLFNYGGGVRNLYGASLTIARSTISHNSARTGGGIANSFGDLLIVDSTLFANTAFAGGGALDNRGDLALPFMARIISSTISGNTAQGSGGGISIYGRMSISHSTISKNQGQPGYGSGVASAGTAATSQTDVSHTIIAGNINSDVDFAFDDGNSFHSVGNNLIGIGNAAAFFNLPGDQTGVLNPMLGELADNGGPTLTHALLSNSPAVNAGNPAVLAGVNGVPVFDQRGLAFNRVVNGRIDIGAFELQPPAPSADFDEDHDVDGADFLAWQCGLGATGATATRANGNADADADVDSADFGFWKAQFGGLPGITPAELLLTAMHGAEQPSTTDAVFATFDLSGFFTAPETSVRWKARFWRR